jgi:hypothetical protein
MPTSGFILSLSLSLSLSPPLPHHPSLTHTHTHTHLKKFTKEKALSSLSDTLQYIPNSSVNAIK